MTKLEEILKDNKEFVESKGYENFSTSKKPNRKIVILSCMDTRLTSLLPSAMNIKNGDVKLIKNAGAVVTHPFGSTMRSIIVSICEFDVDEVMVVGHYECGMCNDVKLIKNAGAVVTHPFGSTMRSIIVSICEFDVDEVMVVGHYECGMCNENTDEMIEKIKEKGISEEVIKYLKKKLIL